MIRTRATEGCFIPRTNAVPNANGALVTESMWGFLNAGRSGHESLLLKRLLQNPAPRPLSPPLISAQHSGSQDTPGEILLLVFFSGECGLSKCPQACLQGEKMLKRGQGWGRLSSDLSGCAAGKVRVTGGAGS